jgi:translocation and assembly module TamB
MRRRLPLIAACLVAAFVAAIAALPWWLEPVLVRAGRSLGAHFGGYERIGYARFALLDVEVRQSGVLVTASRVEADTPLVWLLRRWTGRPRAISIDRWDVTVETEDNGPVSPRATTTSGWLPLREALFRVAAGLDHWLPMAKIGAGTVRWPGGGLAIASGTWAKQTMAVKNLAFGPLKANATLGFFAGEDALRLVVRTLGENGSANLESRGKNITGKITGWEQDVALNARFGEHGWLPSEATVQTGAWQVPGERLRIGELYTTVRGHGRIEWRDRHFTVEAGVNAEPVAGKVVPLLEASLSGHGDSQTFTMEKLNARLPGIIADLSEPVTVDRHGRFLQGNAAFSVKLDLAKLPLGNATGTVDCEARLEAGVAQPPVVAFTLSGRNVAVDDVDLGAVRVAGRFAWPRVEVAAGTITTADSKITWSGGWDLQTKEILGGTVAGRISQGTLARWLPAQPRFQAISINVRFSGPLANLTHAGDARAEGVTLPGLKPVAMAFTWRGRGDAIENFSGKATAGTTTIAAEGAATPKELRLTGLTFGRGDTTYLKLAAPTTVRWSPTWQMEGLQFSGSGDLGASLTSGKTGRIEIAMHRVLSAWFTELAALPGPAWRVNSLAITGEWNHGPMTFSVIGDAAVDLGSGRTATVAVAAKGDPKGLWVEALRATEGSTTFFTASGRIPVVFAPCEVPSVQIEPGGALIIEAATDSNTAFWGKIEALTGVRFKEPHATAHMTGTWARPSGEIRVTAAQVAVDPQRFRRPLPAVDALDIVLTGDRGVLKLDTFSAKIEGQEVRAQGRLPIDDGGWDKLRQDPLAFAQGNAEVHLEVPDAELAAFTPFLSPCLAPKGRLQLDLNYSAGGSLKGFLKLHDAASRPLGPLGVLQDINADLQMSGHRLELSSVTATAGGQPVTLSGSILFSADGTPNYDVALRGHDLPFIRQTGLLVRGDLNLNLHTPAIGPTALSGTVQLRDSLFLSDVRAFLPGVTYGEGSQPPYFAVDTPPFNAWTLGVDIRGDHFMRLRTPAFNGIASARFHLGGTLGEPRAIGEVTIDEGQVLLPFTRFEVKQGTVRIGEEDPHKLALFVRGSARFDGYDLTMEITGAAEAPNIVFTSSPALDSDQLLMMVMTGSAPSNGTGYSSTQRFARIGTYLGQGLLGSFGVDAADSERLSIVPGETISEQGRETYTVEYKLADRWTSVGEYDQFDDYNIGLKWRLFPGKHKPEASPDEPK